MWPFDKLKKKSKAKRSYAGAMVGRLLNDWIASSTSADVEIKGSLRKLRDRARQMARDNEWAKNTIRTLANNVIGEGVRFQAQVKQIRGNKLDEKTNEAIELSWEQWKEKQNCHAAGVLAFEDIESLLIKSIAESGEVFVRIVSQKMGDSKVPMALEIIESDQLDDLYNENLEGGRYVKLGVEKNSWGRPIAYHFFSSHPGDDRSYTYTAQRRMRIPAEEIIHLFPVDRLGQTRGVPIMAATLLRLHQMSGYEEAEVINARATAALMGFVESPEGENPLADDVVGTDRVTEFEPGLFKYLAPGEKIHVPQLQRPSGQFEPFIRANLRGVSAGVGISYESLSKDYSQSNYSSTRQALLEDRVNYKIIQKWIIRNFHKHVFDRWLDLAVLSGEVKLKNYDQNPAFYKAGRWLPRGWSWIDPLKDVEANKTAVRSGFKTLSEVAAENGQDLEELFAQRHRELKMAEEYGLVFDTDPGKMDNKGASQGILPPEDPQSTASGPVDESSADE